MMQKLYLDTTQIQNSNLRKVPQESILGHCTTSKALFCAFFETSLEWLSVLQLL